MSKIMAVLLLAYSILALDQYIEQFRYWCAEQKEENKRERLRRKAIQTNRDLYKVTKEPYYMERVKELELWK